MSPVPAATVPSATGTGTASTSMVVTRASTAAQIRHLDVIVLGGLVNTTGNEVNALVATGWTFALIDTDSNGRTATSGSWVAVMWKIRTSTDTGTTVTVDWSTQTGNTTSPAQGQAAAVAFCIPSGQYDPTDPLRAVGGVNGAAELATTTNAYLISGTIPVDVDGTLYYVATSRSDAVTWTVPAGQSSDVLVLKNQVGAVGSANTSVVVRYQNADVTAGGSFSKQHNGSSTSVGEAAAFVIKNLPRPTGNKVIIKDTFTRADTTGALGAAELGGNWKNNTAFMGILSNGAVKTSGAATTRYISLLPCSVTGDLTLDALIKTSPTANTTDTGLVIRALDSTATRGGQLYVSIRKLSTANSVRVLHRANTSGSDTVLVQNTTADWADGATYWIKVVIVGKTIDVLRDGVSIIGGPYTIADAVLATLGTDVGITFTNSDTGSRIEDFYATDPNHVDAPPTPTPVENWVASGMVAAHRGGSNDWPESTMYAYDQSVIWGAKCLEISIWPTSDGVWIASHDQTMDRVFGTAGVDIPTTTYAQLLTYRHPWGQQTIAKLTDILDKYWGIPDMCFMIDNKYGNNMSGLLDLLDTYTDANKRIIIKAYRSATTLATAATNRGYPTWGYYYPGADVTSLPTSQQYWTYLGMEWNAAQSDWDTIKSYGKKVMAHQPTTAAQAVTARAAGADGIMAAGLTKILPRANTYQAITSWDGAQEVVRTASIWNGTEEVAAYVP